MLLRSGPANGTVLLPLDQALEHRFRDFLPNPASVGVDPSYQLRLTEDGGLSGIALQAGIAERYVPPSPVQVSPKC
jgi:DhnA family fructose-bisphosphate aldolase class Ia